MIKLSSVLLIFLICACTRISKAQDDVGQLRHFEVVFRHGDRNPVQYPPTMPNLWKIWPNGPGELTYRGAVQEFELGQILNKRIGSFVGTNFSVKYYSMRSTYTGRTIMSAEAFDAGLYFDNKSPIPGYKWSPVPVFTVPKVHDYIGGDVPCPLNHQLQQERLHYPPLMAATEKRAAMYKLVNENTGYPYPINQTNVWAIEDPLNCLWKHDYALPCWCTEETLQELHLAFAESWYYQFGSKQEIIRLSFGVYLNDLANRLYQRATNTTVPNPVLPVLAFSAHDFQVTYALAAFGLFNEPQIVPYSAAVFIELYGPQYAEGVDKFTVRVAYRNGSKDMNPSFYKLPWCTEQATAQDGCPLSKVLDRLEPLRITPEERNVVCQQTSTGDGGLPNANRIVLIVSLVLIALCFITLVAMLIVYLCDYSCGDTCC